MMHLVKIKQTEAFAKWEAEGQKSSQKRDIRRAQRLAADWRKGIEH